jgi:hypothetical protein
MKIIFDGAHRAEFFNLKGDQTWTMLFANIKFIEYLKNILKNSLLCR